MSPPPTRAPVATVVATVVAVLVLSRTPPPPSLLPLASVSFASSPPRAPVTVFVAPMVLPRTPPPPSESSPVAAAVSFPAEERERERQRGERRARPVANHRRAAAPLTCSVGFDHVGSRLGSRRVRFRRLLELKEVPARCLLREREGSRSCGQTKARDDEYLRSAASPHRRRHRLSSGVGRSRGG